MGRQLKYDQAQLAILDVIATEKLKPGDKLMPERQLVNRVNCSMITVRAALKSLEEQNIITRRAGRGTFVSCEIPLARHEGHVLFVNIERAGGKDFPPDLALRWMRHHFETRGIGFEMLTVSEFNQKLLKSAGGALGILLYGWLTPEMATLLEGLGVPLLIVGSSQPIPGVAQVHYHVGECTRRLIKRLAHTGARRFALFNGERSYSIAQEIMTGFESTLAELGLELDPEGVYWSDYELLERQMDEVMPRLAMKYDAVLMETGAYPAYLTAANYHHWRFPARFGVLPLFKDMESHERQHLFREGPDLFFGRIDRSVFLTAAELFQGYLAGKNELYTISID